MICKWHFGIRSLTAFFLCHKHTRTRTHTHTHSLFLYAHTHAHTYSLTLFIIHSLPLTLSLSLSHTHKLSISYSLSLTPTLYLSLSLSLSLLHSLSFFLYISEIPHLCKSNGIAAKTRDKLIERDKLTTIIKMQLWTLAQFFFLLQFSTTYK